MGIGRELSRHSVVYLQADFVSQASHILTGFFEYVVVANTPGIADEGVSSRIYRQSGGDDPVAVGYVYNQPTACRQ